MKLLIPAFDRLPPNHHVITVFVDADAMNEFIGQFFAMDHGYLILLSRAHDKSQISTLTEDFIKFLLGMAPLPCPLGPQSQQPAHARAAVRTEGLRFCPDLR